MQLQKKNQLAFEKLEIHRSMAAVRKEFNFMIAGLFDMHLYLRGVVDIALASLIVRAIVKLSHMLCTLLSGRPQGCAG